MRPRRGSARSRCFHQQALPVILPPWPHLCCCTHILDHCVPPHCTAHPPQAILIHKKSQKDTDVAAGLPFHFDFQNFVPHHEQCTFSAKAQGDVAVKLVEVQLPCSHARSLACSLARVALCVCLSLSLSIYLPLSSPRLASPRLARLASTSNQPLHPGLSSQDSVRGDPGISDKAMREDATGTKSKLHASHLPVHVLPFALPLVFLWLACVQPAFHPSDLNSRLPPCLFPPLARASRP
jgi:hypothetical protein